MPQEKRFYALLGDLGELVAASLVELKAGLVEGRPSHEVLLVLEHRSKGLTREIHALINRTFVTPIDRQDLYQLASSLGDVVDMAEEAADKIHLYGIGRVTPRAEEAGILLARAGAEISLALAGLDGFHGLDERRIEIHRLENQADAVNREAIAELFGGNLPAAELIKWKDVYDLLEQAMDRCEQVANLLESIAIKSG